MTFDLLSQAQFYAPASTDAPQKTTLPNWEQSLAQIELSLNQIERMDGVAWDPSRGVPELSVVIPVFNEARTVGAVIDRVLTLPIAAEVIVVDDGSSDGTAGSLKRFAYNPRVVCISHDRNRGKGAALRTGIAQAKGDLVVVQDADLEYDPINILSVIRPLQTGLAEVAYGSRYLQNSHQDPSIVHRFGNWLLTSLSNLMTRQQLTDMETCYKAFRRELIQSITIEENRFGFEPEITAKVAKRCSRIHEVPITYQARSKHEGKKIGWKDLVRTLYCIARYSLLS